MTTEPLPDPLVPPEVDLTDFRFMPLEVARLLDSEIMALQDAEAFRAGVASWCKGWHQIPAASLPDDDGALCKTLGYGRDLKTWAKLRKAGALRGWILCSDGRLYHPVVAEKALEAWLEKLAQRLSSGAGNAKRWGVDFDPRQINEQIAAAREYLARLNPQSKALSKRKPPTVPAAIPADNQPGLPADDARQSRQESRRDDSRESRRDRNRQGQGHRQGEGSTGIGESSAGGLRARTRDEAGPPADEPDAGIPDAVSAVVRGVRGAFEDILDLPDRPIAPADEELFADWIAAGTARGLSPAEAAEAVVTEVRRQFRRLDERQAGPPRSLRAVLDTDVRAAIANAKPGSAPKPLPEVPAPYAQHFDRVTWANWIAPCRVEVADGIARVFAPNSLIRQRVDTDYTPALKAALGVADIEVVLDGKTPPPARPTANVIPLMGAAQ